MSTIFIKKYAAPFLAEVFLISAECFEISSVVRHKTNNNDLLEKDGGIKNCIYIQGFMV